MKKIYILIPMIFILTGCYNYRELNDLAIISGVSIQKNDDTYKITTEIINPKKEQDTSSGKEPDYIIYEGTGKSMQEAFRNIVKESPQKLYGAQIDILIIDEETAKEGIDDILDFFARDPEVRSEFYVIISKNSEPLKIISPLVNISSKNIINSLKATNTYLGTANLVTYHQLISDYLNPNIEIALPSIIMKGNSKTGDTIDNIETTSDYANNIISNIAIFKNEKMLGYLDANESLAYNIITNNTRTFLLRTNYNNNDFIENEIIDSTTKIDIKNNKIIITIKGNASIAEVNKKLNLENTKEITKLQKELNNNLEKLILTSIKDTTKKYNTDIYGFKDLFYKSDPPKYKQLIKEQGDNFLKKLDIQVKGNIKIIEKGNLNGGIYNE